LIKTYKTKHSLNTSL